MVRTTFRGNLNQITITDPVGKFYTVSYQLENFIVVVADTLRMYLKCVGYFDSLYKISNPNVVYFDNLNALCVRLICANFPQLVPFQVFVPPFRKHPFGSVDSQTHMLRSRVATGMVNDTKVYRQRCIFLRLHSFFSAQIQSPEVLMFGMFHATANKYRREFLEFRIRLRGFRCILVRVLKLYDDQVLRTGVFPSLEADLMECLLMSNSIDCNVCILRVSLFCGIKREFLSNAKFS